MNKQILELSKNNHSFPDIRRPDDFVKDAQSFIDCQKTKQQQSDRIAELEADKARLLEMLKYSESAMRRCDDQFRNAKYAVLWFDAADDCLSDANWFKDVIAEMESSS